MNDFQRKRSALRTHIRAILPRAIVAVGMASAFGCAARQHPPTETEEAGPTSTPDNPLRAPRVNTERMRETVHKLSVDLVPRDFSHPENLDKAARGT